MYFLCVVSLSSCFRLDQKKHENNNYLRQVCQVFYFSQELAAFHPFCISNGDPSYMLLLLTTGFTMGMGGQMQPWFHAWSDNDFYTLENSNTSPQQSKNCCRVQIGQINKKQNLLLNGCERDYFMILRMQCFSKQVFMFEWFLNTSDSCVSVGKIHTDYLLK